MLMSSMETTNQSDMIQTHTVDALTLADYILLKSAEHGWVITPLKLNKLCYLIQGFMLKNHDRPAFKNDIEAWPYGPVIPDVYEAFKHCGGDPIRRLYSTNESVCLYEQVSQTKENLAGKIGQEIKNITDLVVKQYANIPGGKLIGMTHVRDTPWHQTKRSFAILKPKIIDTGIIMNYYKQLKPGQSGR